MARARIAKCIRMFDLIVRKVTCSCAPAIKLMKERFQIIDMEIKLCLNPSSILILVYKPKIGGCSKLR